ncbi:MAG: peptidylprolyl isomerase [Myxococcota bacterium]
MILSKIPTTPNTPAGTATGGHSLGPLGSTQNPLGLVTLLWISLGTVFFAGCPALVADSDVKSKDLADDSVHVIHSAPAIDGNSRTQTTRTGASTAGPHKHPPPGVDSQIAARHILIQFEGASRARVDRTRNEARSLVRNLLSKAQEEGADFQALAKEHSEGPSGARGGDLGTFSRGRMVPEFERTAFDLRVGEISDVVETPFGFHIIQRYR